MTFYDEIEQVNFSTELPKTMLKVKQSFDRPRVHDVAAATKAALQESGLLNCIGKYDSVAIGVGSRGIANLTTIVKATVDAIKSRGAVPFIVPAMGSHGGATPDGQTQVLTNLGITLESTGAEIRATMQVVEVGKLPDNGPPVYQDVISAAAHHVLLINRIKAHTSFRSNIESGLAKMAVIGLGKQHGAATMHARGVIGLKTYLAPAARIYEQNTNLRGGLAILENAYDETAAIVGLTDNEIGSDKEAELLVRSKSLMARLPFGEIDTLVVRELGKNLSGTGMDTNVIRRFKIPRQPEPTDGPDIGTICVLNVTDASHGNANGMGLANVITARLARKVDWKATYTNALTSGVLGMWKAAMPITMADDCRAIQAAVLGCGELPEDARIVLVQNTLVLDELWVSPNMLDIVQAHSRLSVVEEVALSFDDQGIMQSPWQMA